MEHANNISSTKDFVEKGYATLALTTDEAAILQNFLFAGKSFFAQDIDTKRQFSITTFRRGYFTDRNVREFIRLLPPDVESLPFPDEFKTLYRNAQRILYDNSMKMLSLILDSARLSGSDSSYDKLFEEIDLLCKKHGNAKSVVSMIHYLPITHEDIATEDSENEYLQNWGSTQIRSALHQKEAVIKPDHYAHCRVHEDSNLFTLILCSDTPGLQVWDKSKNEFVEVEREATAGLDVFCVLGRKLTDVVSTLTPTTHRVVLPYSTERYSLIFFVHF